MTIHDLKTWIEETAERDGFAEVRLRNLIHALVSQLPREELVEVARAFVPVVQRSTDV